MQYAVVFVACAALLLSATVRASDTLLCVRAKSFEPGQEFLQTRQLKVRSEGPPLEALLGPVASRIARDRLWPNLKLDEVQVSMFDAQVCGHEPVAELNLRVNADEIATIGAEMVRGPGDRPQLSAVARRSSAIAAPLKAPPPATPATATRHEWVRLYFATTRQPTGASKSGEAFGADRSNALTYGSVDVSIPTDHRWANLESPSILRLEWDVDPGRHVKLADDLQILSYDSLRDVVARQAGAFDKPGVLLFVHGFNNTFVEAAQRAAQLTYDLSFAGPTVLFSWPSDGDVLSYTRDEEQARTAWRQMALVLDQLTLLGPGVPVYVIAHSMGSRVLTQGMAELIRRRPGAARSFRQVVLASPDIGEEEFRQRWTYELASSATTRYTLYASRQDLPVSLSAWLHGEARLGSGGSNIAVLEGLDSVDASAITKEWFGLSHSYFGDNETVMSDLFLVINRGLEPARRPRLKSVSGKRGNYFEFRR